MSDINLGGGETVALPPRGAGGAGGKERSTPSAIWHRRRIGCRPGATEILQGIMRPNPVIEAGSSSKKRRLSKVITWEDDEDEDEVVEEEDEDFNITSLFRPRTLQEFPGGGIGFPKEVVQFIQGHNVSLSSQFGCGLGGLAGHSLPASSLGIVCGSTFLDHPPIRPSHEFNSDACTRFSSGALFHKFSKRHHVRLYFYCTATFGSISYGHIRLYFVWPSLFRMATFGFISYGHVRLYFVWPRSALLRMAMFGFTSVTQPCSALLLSYSHIGCTSIIWPYWLDFYRPAMLALLLSYGRIRPRMCLRAALTDVVTPLNVNRWQSAMNRLRVYCGNTSFEQVALIPTQIRAGFDFGLRHLPREPFAPSKHVSDDDDAFRQVAASEIPRFSMQGSHRGAF
ncbi:BZ3500_MvSof-1268-A1-R1_Chr10-2g03017 [Microbotryum saponariae]|uniref:BZ3500_MvSof-1268-A1-R1_Chr10-2g03017 protein n=1 Tax=Microbotryum saponariae TaxID=289078 RepID=A0A2X0KD49_9BASI|nr:BZ3501_MvSof-1269-A2-R1_Chr10-2g02603 [Microbotryum saponariae]SDA01932.1 BZ3500_MvSof-1268-A1-R1_Chr10-2g03017 [Microbotryum saponariae]